MGKNAKNKRKESLEKALAETEAARRQHPKHRLLPLDFIEAIKGHGLDIDDFPFFVEAHVAWPSGYSIVLPEEAGGNVVPEWESWFPDREGNERITRMPSMKIWGSDGAWNIEVHAWVPGPGPGDFQLRFETPEQALETILSYYYNPEDPRFVAMHDAHT